jgi:chromosome transmission fidelity protein 1
MVLAPSTYPFPFPPYPIQLQLMTALTRTLDAGHVGVFESPTGSGKSLSIICSVIPWVLRNPSVVPDADVKTELGVGPSWLKDHQDALVAQSLAQRQLAHEQLCARFESAQLLRPAAAAAMHPTSSGNKSKRPKIRHARSSSSSSSASSSSVRVREEERSAFVHQRKVFYCSRTHTQLGQFLHELTRVYGREITAVALASRKQLCVNASISGSHRINEACLDLQDTSAGCAYLRNQPGSRALQDAALYEVHDIEDLHKRGRAVGACAYYSMREAMQSAQVVVLPYSMLLHEGTRQSLNIDLEGHVVVCDEAHNVIDAISDMHASSITLSLLEQAEKEVRLYLQKYKDRFNLDNAATLSELASVTCKLGRFLAKETQPRVWLLDKMLDAAMLADNNLFELVGAARDAQLAKKLKGIAREMQASAPADVSVVVVDSAMQRVLNFVDALNSKAEDGRVSVRPAAAQLEAQLKFLLLNPGSRFAKVVEKAHSVILAGGTMHPVDDLVQQLFGAGPGQERVDLFSCGHVIPDSNLVALACKSGPSGKELRLTYDTRGQAGMLDEVGQALLRLCRQVPAGMVVFLPSYAFEAELAARLDSTGVLQAIGGVKPVVREKAAASGQDSAWDAYLELVSRPGGSGAMLLAVVGGKLSEGINFSDDLARCVVMVGLPYASKADLELSAKMQFMGEPAASRYYENLCWRGVNQSIGRAIRHAKDYAAIVLLDTRYSSPKSKASLPGWIASRYQACESWAPVERQLQEFFKRKDSPRHV